jgi:F-type H+-transporting ATPase subunit a
MVAQQHGHSSVLVIAAPMTMIWQGFSVFIGAIQAYVFSISIVCLFLT